MVSMVTAFGSGTPEILTAWGVELPPLDAKAQPVARSSVEYSTLEDTIMPEPLLSANNLAEMLGVPLGTIYRWNHRGDGPVPLHIGRHVRYRLQDVERWIDEQAVRGFGPVGHP